jgi:hypothetical protein
VKTRVTKSAEFCHRATAVLAQVTLQQTTAAVLLLLVHQFNRSAFLCATRFDLHESERTVAALVRINLGNERFALSLLFDRLRPTRRLEQSPLRYTVPDFASERPLFEPPRSASSRPFPEELHKPAIVRGQPVAFPARQLAAFAGRDDGGVTSDHTGGASRRSGTSTSPLL